MESEQKPRADNAETILKTFSKTRHKNRKEKRSMIRSMLEARGTENSMSDVLAQFP